MSENQPDFEFFDYGTLWRCRPTTDDARKHLKDNTDDEALWFGDALIVDPRFVEGLAEGLTENGFTTNLS